MKTETPRKMALLIDADNLSPNDVEAVFDYLDKSGYLLPVRRAYGGYEKLSGMKDVLRQRSVRALVNQGKGTTDVSLVVDAMDLLHGSQLPSTVAIVSSDADFAPLALRLREADICVLCFANRLNATPGALAIAYAAVVFVDDLVKSTSEDAADEVKPARKSSGRSAAVRKTAPVPAIPMDADAQVAQAAVSKKVSRKTKASTPIKVEAPDLFTAKENVAPSTLATSVLPSEVEAILEVVPALKTGQPQALALVAKALLDAKLRGKNMTATKLLKKFPSHFALLPVEKPRTVIYAVPHDLT
jgi:hypothetical protein